LRRLQVCLAIPGRILEITPESERIGLVDVGGVRRRVDLSLLEDEKPGPGDWVLIHVGFALSKISEQDALDQMRILRVLGEDQAAMEEVRGYGLGEPEDRSQRPENGSQKSERAEVRSQESDNRSQKSDS
jgi:hydrogenase expression/formation protein HypC